MAEAVARVSAVPVPVRAMWTPADCPAPLLPWMAWAFSVDNWNSTWSDAQKRGTIAASVGVHQHKGTVGAINSAIASLGFSSRLIEWQNQSPVGTPYTFKIELTAGGAGWTLAQLKTLLAVVQSTKNLRSHLDAVNPVIRSTGNLYCGALAKIGHQITVKFSP